MTAGSGLSVEILLYMYQCLCCKFTTGSYDAILCQHILTNLTVLVSAYHWFLDYTLLNKTR